MLCFSLFAIRHLHLGLSEPFPAFRSRSMRAVLYCLVSLTLGVEVAIPAELVVVIVDNSNDLAWKSKHLQFFEEYDYLEQLKSSGRLQFWKTDPYSKYRAGFDSVKGTLFTIDRKGNVLRHGFATVENRDVFETYVNDVANRLSGRMTEDKKVVVDDTEDGITITTPAFTDKNGAASPAWEQRFRYHDTVVLSGFGPVDRPNTIAQVPIKGLARLVNPAKKKMWLLTYRPSLVPDSSKEALLSQVQRVSGVKFQQADQESDGDYSLRRTIGETYLNLFQSLVKDVDEVTAWSEWPEDQQPYKARLELHAKKNSGLAKLISELRPKRSQVLELDPRAGEVRVHIGIPEMLKPFLSAVVSKLAIESDGLTEALVKAISEGQIDLDATVLQTKLGPSLVGGVRLAIQPNVLRELEAIGLQGTVSGATFRSTQRLVVEGQDFGEFKVLLHGGDQIKFASTKGDVAEAQEVLNGMGDFKREQSKRSLIDANLDLKQLVSAEDESPTRVFAKRLEQIVARKWLRPQDPREASVGAPDKEYESLIKRANPDGDWSIRASLRSNSHSLFVDVTIGRDLFGFYLMRKMFD
ncbi:MAG: hypothetical protein AB8G99_12195 [Planctomycetaceae bacterium]